VSQTRIATTKCTYQGCETYSTCQKWHARWICLAHKNILMC